VTGDRLALQEVRQCGADFDAQILLTRLGAIRLTRASVARVGP
jgi:hypothetical protein